MRQNQWALFISGQGSNMTALLEQEEASSVRLIVSSKRKAAGLARARRSGIETLILDREINWAALYRELDARKITHIFLVGFMRVVPTEFLQKWKRPILNVHPSLLPLYPGLKSLERASADQAAIGATVHRVIADVDAGPTVFQKTVFSAKSYATRSRESLEFALHLAEYHLVRRAFQVASCWTS